MTQKQWNLKHKAAYFAEMSTKLHKYAEDLKYYAKSSKRANEVNLTEINISCVGLEESLNRLKKTMGKYGANGL